jgi:hypothetical protein
VTEFSWQVICTTEQALIHGLSSPIDLEKCVDLIVLFASPNAGGGVRAGMYADVANSAENNNLLDTCSLLRHNTPLHSVSSRILLRWWTDRGRRGRASGIKMLLEAQSTRVIELGIAEPKIEEYTHPPCPAFILNPQSCQTYIATDKIWGSTIPSPYGSPSSLTYTHTHIHT